MPLPAAAAASAAGRAVAPALLRDVGCHAPGAARRPALSSAWTVPCRPRHHALQRRWAQVHDVRFVATTQAPRRVLDKYRDKLDRKARDEGLAGIDQLKAAYADRIRQQRRADAISVPGLDQLLAADGLGPSDAAAAAPETSEAGVASTTTAKDNNNNNNNNNPSPAPQSSGGGGQITPLSEILDLAKARTLPVAELTALWRRRHASVADSICAVVPAATYAGMEALARLRPQFVLPVPHPDQGAEVHFLQWTFDAATRTSTVLFTQLAEYRARGEFAQPHTTATHYTDLAGTGAGGVVLMRGVVDGRRGVKVADAQWLLMCLQRFYGGWDVAAEGGSGSSPVTDERAAERRKLLEWFGTGDQRFSIEKLLEETERLG
ncbi:hypothetical protein RB595_009277 [Gaeumannomyces hyphopodioides]